ncbi:hypothetical protein N7492_003109 [Penicillium capsulatum]|uniref:Transcription factor Iwr1 domain-containing protein n=1 Tax=Penicillium capsulatum TaxID=69766 RepID=A0A9W9ILA8_9EURO|nr:hypothetical protein N7492_003109 [Penicillium capsulatum]
MALPPEHINIKRRREEEPVETLYIESALHQSKRRFTDFVFQRVTISSKDKAKDGDSPDDKSPAPIPAAQRLLRSPRSVSSLQIPNRRKTQATSSSGVPLVRATSPGAEIREAQRVIAAKKEAEEKRQRSLYSSPVPPPVQETPPVLSGSRPSTSDQRPKSASSHAQPLRRFQISRPSGISHGQSHSFGGIQKRRTDGSTPGVAVLVEQLRRTPHSRQASMVADLVGQAHVEGQHKNINISEPSSQGTKPRKRPVVNQAERQWRQEQQSSMSAAKERFSELLEKSAQARQSSHDEEEERLVREFEQVALEIEQGSVGQAIPPQNAPRMPVSVTKKPSKFYPRSPKKPRSVQAQQASADASIPNAAVPTGEDSEDDYVYDVYIRRPLADMDMLRNPLAEHESEEQAKQVEGPKSGVGVIVITPDDEDIWENFVEDDEEEWDSEDADSNAEDNPANDYPDEEGSSDDEDPIWGKHRSPAMSDDEYDMNGSDSDGGSRLRTGFGYRGGFVGRGHSDDDST